MTNSPSCEVATVTLNPAIDLTVTIDNFTAGEVNRVQTQRSNAGGKGVNVAAALSDYGHTVTATGFLGHENSSIFEKLFLKKQIGDRFIRTAGQTRFGLKISDFVRVQTTDINFPGPGVKPEDTSRLLGVLESIDAPWFVLAGSLPPEIPVDIYREITRNLKAAGRKVVIDASGEALRLALEAAPDIVKPNLSELEMLLGKKLTTRDKVMDAARSLVERGIRLVVVSMGEEGALFVSAEQVILAVPPRVPVLSTVGAGDAMVAGTVAAQLRGFSLEQTARLATAFSLDVITHPGTGLSSARAIEKFVSQVQLQTLR